MMRVPIHRDDSVQIAVLTVVSTGVSSSSNPPAWLLILSPPLICASISFSFLYFSPPWLPLCGTKSEADAVEDAVFIAIAAAVSSAARKAASALSGRCSIRPLLNIN